MFHVGGNHEIPPRKNILVVDSHENKNSVELKNFMRVQLYGSFFVSLAIFPRALEFHETNLDMVKKKLAY